MSNPAATFPVSSLAPRSRNEQRTVLRSLPPTPDLIDEEDGHGWLAAHLDKLLAFVGSAALSAALISHLLPVAPVAAVHPAPPPAPVPAVHVSAPAPVAVAPAPVAVAPARPVVVATAPAPAPVEVAAPPSHETTAPVARVVHVAKKAVHAKKKHRARPHARRVAHEAPPRATARVVHAQSVAAASAASVDGLVAEGTEALRRHDEAEAIRDFEGAKAAAAEAGRPLPHAIRQKLGLLHVAAALRDRRAGNEAGAHREFEAAHRADPDNVRASAELSAPADEVELHDAIDPD